METPEWIEQGRCHSKPHLTYLFFSDDPSEQKAAMSMCSTCPVRSFCLAAALERREKFGIWGYSSPADRKRMLNRDNG